MLLNYGISLLKLNLVKRQKNLCNFSFPVHCTDPPIKPAKPIKPPKPQLLKPKKPDRSKSKVINHEETQFQAYGNENASTKQKLKKESKLSHIEINIDQMTGGI